MNELRLSDDELLHVSLYTILQLLQTLSHRLVLVAQLISLLHLCLRHFDEAVQNTQ